MNTPTQIYLDLDVINNADPSVDDDPPVLRFEEIRTSPFVMNTGEYFLSIIRFSLQTGSILPVFIPRIQTGQSDVNLTVYIISLVFRATSTSTPTIVSLPIEYVPKNTQPIPQQPINVQDLSTSYYYVQSYQDFVSMMNTTLQQLWTNLTSQISSQVTLPATPPFILFDPDNGKFIIYGNLSYFSESIVGGAEKIELWFNTRLFELMSAFPSYNAGSSGNQNFRILFNNNFNTNVQQINYTNPVTSAAVQYSALQVFQEICTLSMFNPICSIVFASSFLPVLPTSITPPKVFNDTSLALSSNGNNGGLISMLTDFEVPYSETNQYRPTIDYNPGTEYRLLDMNPVMNLNRVDILVYWKTTFGELIPMKLQPGCSGHVKIMLRHKTFYLGI